MGVRTSRRAGALPLVVGWAEGERSGRGDRSRVLARKLGRELSMDAAAGRRGAGGAEADDERVRLHGRRAGATARDDRRWLVRRSLPAPRRGDAANLGRGRGRSARATRKRLAPLTQPLRAKSQAVYIATVLVVAGGAGATPRGVEVERLPTKARVVALTFDGGGDTASGTALILKTLRRHHVPATFFLTGRWIRLHPRPARTIGRRYPIGDHTYDHAQQTGLTSAQIRADVRRGAWWIRAETGRDPRPLFRFPYGARDARTIAVVNSMGYVSVRWSLDTWGWMGRARQSRAGIVRRVLERVRPGEIVLMHAGAAKDGSTLDTDALPAVIRGLRARGYRFIRLDRWVRR